MIIINTHTHTHTHTTHTQHNNIITKVIHTHAATNTWRGHACRSGEKTHPVDQFRLSKGGFLGEEDSCAPAASHNTDHAEDHACRSRCSDGRADLPSPSRRPVAALQQGIDLARHREQTKSDKLRSRLVFLYSVCPQSVSVSLQRRLKKSCRGKEGSLCGKATHTHTHTHENSSSRERAFLLRVIALIQHGECQNNGRRRSHCGNARWCWDGQQHVRWCW
jgi:hypothetical protein